MILSEVEQELNKNSYLAVWVEPVLQKSMEKLPYEFLKGLREITKKYNVALIYNETASQMYHYSHKNFFVSSFEDISPDAGMIYTGGQSGLVFCDEKYFLEQPLMLISTWDGDEFSFNTYHHAFKKIIDNKDNYLKTMKTFHMKVIDLLSKFEMDVIKIENGVGHFKGSIPSSLEKQFKKNEGHQYTICPSFDEAVEFISHEH
jgi:acetylornithine/succinyldiaminopimelate/putrescine aminotransferase